MSIGAFPLSSLPSKEEGAVVSERVLAQEGVYHVVGFLPRAASD